MATKAVYKRCLNPACGSYRVTDTTQRVNPKTGKGVWNPFASGCLTSLGLLVLAILIGALLVPSFTSAYGPAGSQDAANVVTVVWAVVTVIAFLAVFTRYRNMVQLHQYECSLCGFKWIWMEGDPEPTEPVYHPTGVAQAGADLNNRMATAIAYEEQRRREQERRNR
jgi:hypothetical protein